MHKNVGPYEQWFRVAAGSAALAAAFLLPERVGGWRWLLGLWGVANLTTGVARWCPSNALFGVDNTRGSEFMHFSESRHGVRGRVGRRLNRMQQRVGATFR